MRPGGASADLVGVAVLLPAVLSVFLLVVAAGLLSPTRGAVAIGAWLIVGVLVWTRVGERAVVRLLLRYRSAPGSWLAAEIPALIRDVRCVSMSLRAPTGVPGRGVHHRHRSVLRR